MRKIIVLLILMISLTGCSQKTEDNEIKQISCSEKDQLLKEKESTVLIDVRTEEEYKEKHLDEAINISYENIVESLKENEKITKNTPIIVYCKSGGRSSVAADSLIKNGYKEVYDLGAISNCD